MSDHWQSGRRLEQLLPVRAALPRVRSVRVGNRNGGGSFGSFGGRSTRSTQTNHLLKPLLTLSLSSAFARRTPHARFTCSNSVLHHGFSSPVRIRMNIVLTFFLDLVCVVRCFTFF
jgi:hypothetical protein